MNELGSHPACPGASLKGVPRCGKVCVAEGHGVTRLPLTPRHPGGSVSERRNQGLAE